MEVELKSGFGEGVKIMRKLAALCTKRGMTIDVKRLIRNRDIRERYGNEVSLLGTVYQRT